MNEDVTIKRWVGGICIKNDTVLLIHRINPDRDFTKEYFIFPGKDVEGDESIEDALIEAFEDIGVHVERNDLFYEKEDDGETEYYYFCDYLLGEPLPPKSKEEEPEEQIYEPIWISLNDLEDLIIYPEEVKTGILEQRSFENEED